MPIDCIHVIIIKRLILHSRVTQLHVIDFIESMKKAKKRQLLVGENTERVL